MPKSSSPKRSPKSPGKKSSPTKKGSPGKRPANTEPPVDAPIQTEETAVCYFCLRSFNDSAAIQAHIILMDHMPPFDCKEQQCRACKSIVNIKDVEQHKCQVLKATFLRFMSCPATLCHGAPYRCLLCRSRSFGSRVGLAMHLICYHRPNKASGRCGMCAFAYDEPAPPALPTIPPLPNNATEEQKQQHAIQLKAAKEKQLCEAQDSSHPGLVTLKAHVENEHVPAYTLWSRQLGLKDSSRRFPYACPLCDWSFKTNYEFQAHVIGAHANKTQIENDLKICAICAFAASNDAALNQHIQVNHTRPIRHLGNLWIRKELMMNAIDPGDTCIYCWENFRYDFQLQAHLLVAHVTKHALRCGWCKVDFTSCADPILAFMIMQHHERNHGLTLQQVALNNGYTFVPLRDPWPEVPDIEAMIAARTGVATGRSESPKSKKSPKKSPKSKSPKSGSPKSKSPKSASKSKK